MHRLLSGVALSAMIVAGSVAPAFANTNTGSEVTANEVALAPNLVEIEGRTLTNSEAVRVEGQVLRIGVPNTIQFGICVIGVVSPCNGSNWKSNPRLVSPMPIVRHVPSR